MTAERHVFLTGASGCVGHYVVERLLADPRNRVHALLRDPTRLRADLLDRVTVHHGGLEDPLPAEVSEMDAAMFIATAWGGEEARQVNVAAPIAMADMLARGRAGRLIYFSTASLLSSDGQILVNARDHGTGYIQQKFDALMGLSGHPLGDRIIPVFPTIVLGGDERHPYSHALSGLPQVVPWLPLLRRLKLDGSFHLTHAYDVARTAVYLLDHDPPARPVVLGNPLLGVDEAVCQLAEAFGYGRKPQLDLTALVVLLSRIVPGRFTSWDRFCLQQRHFKLPALDVPALLGSSGFETLAGILASDPRLSGRISPRLTARV